MTTEVYFSHSWRLDAPQGSLFHAFPQASGDSWSPVAPLGLYPRHCLHLRVVFSLNLSSHGVPVSGSKFPPSHKGTVGRIGLGVHSTPA